MTEFINKHTIKIQLGVLLAIVSSVMWYTFQASAYVETVKQSAEEIKELKMQTAKIPVLETNVDMIKDDLKEIKTDIKLILKQR